MKTFAELEKHDFFTLQGDFGEVELMKINTLEAICIVSCNGTYQKGKIYCIQFDQICIKTC